MSTEPRSPITPCPRCSSRIRLVRPEWSYARHTSEKRGVRCFIWSGTCSHAQQFFNNDRNPLSDESELSDVETRWTAEVDRQFAELTSHWTDASRAVHAALLGITFIAGSPAQLQQQPAKENGNET